MYLSKLILFIGVFYLTAASAYESEQIALFEPKKYDCTGIIRVKELEKWYVCGDYRLGPKQLPWRLPLLGLVSNYNQLAGLTPKAFLKEYWNTTSEKWIYPEYDGFHLDINGEPINNTMILKPGTKVDRFGSERGRFVSAADAPYTQRSLPPNSLNLRDDTSHNEAVDHPWGYHLYNVTQTLYVSGGPIAPAFGQPGLGAQFYLGPDMNIEFLLGNKSLERLNISNVNLKWRGSNRCPKIPSD